MSQPRSRRASAIRPAPVEYLGGGKMEELLQLRTLTVVAGEPKIAKSLWAYHIAAVASWHGTVLFCTREDRPINEVCVPRLISAKARMDNVITDYNSFSLPADVAWLGRKIEEEGVILVVLDTLDAFLDRGINDPRLRRAFDPVLEMLEGTDCAMLATSHVLTRVTKNMSLQRMFGGGGRGLSGVIRSGFLMVQHPEDADKRIVKHAIHNAGGETRAYTYEVDVTDVRTVRRAGERVTVEIARLNGPLFDARDWSEGEVRELMVASGSSGPVGRPPEKRSACCAALVNALANGPMLKSVLEPQLQLEFSLKTIRNAREELELITKPKGRDSEWSLPPEMLPLLDDERDDDRDAGHDDGALDG
jgi:hypothetical protein